ncbi:cytidine deaminase [Ruficoccus sp. ZRK36]|uniref:cytidine deaminase n=1 Tax=Ruficoccus sp. ZRK36 TaxID=2866311 RepID=UPI0021035A17|nr:cytidine deaminase [Ruficoccus sp. ZRK36]
MNQAKAFAHVPISGYQVGAVLITARGRVFLGANLEFPGQPLSTAVHAEQAALAAALMAGEQSFARLDVSAPPCGHCRQFLREFDRGGLGIRILAAETAPATSTLDHLLPQAFGGEYFSSGLNASEARLPELPDKEWAAAAREALARSHAPYSGNRAVAVLAGGKRLFITGASLENAAFNPSLGPMQCALSQWRMAGHDFKHIEAAWLVQSDTRRVDWELQSRELLASVGVPGTTRPGPAAAEGCTFDAAHRVLRLR